MSPGVHHPSCLIPVMGTGASALLRGGIGFKETLGTTLAVSNRELLCTLLFMAANQEWIKPSSLFLVDRS